MNERRPVQIIDAEIIDEETDARGPIEARVVAELREAERIAGDARSLLADVGRAFRKGAEALSNAQGVEHRPILPRR